MARYALALIICTAASLSLWKTSHYYFFIYIELERWFGGSTYFHFGFWWLIALFAPWAFPQITKKQKYDPIGARLLLILLAIAVLEEFSQAFIPSRGFSWQDVQTNSFGCVAGYFSAQLLSLGWRWIKIMVPKPFETADKRQASKASEQR
ncbi:VanZ family protein [Vibrio sp. SM6]|uniref:VanZ family protein n=2 Tax=Vibrio agarilyticus TaxID=2726741 RepID=A0A7X8TN00_9VIBR|nr:VanZ family protein [Vibrio agarilyticus]